MIFKEEIGELIGTFILVFIGCSSVACSAILGWFPELWQVALVWGVGVALAIFSVRNICPAHLNPAVSFAFWMCKEMRLKQVLTFTVAQLIGAILAGIVVYNLFNPSIILHENLHEIVRGEAGSYVSAVMFGEFYPNPGFEDSIQLNWITAMLIEALGTFLLLISIFFAIAKFRTKENFIPIFIGLSLSVLIFFIAPYTQAGFNPARDFGPRLIAYLGGWSMEAFPKPTHGFLTVYIVGPLFGGLVASIVRPIFGKTFE